MVDNQFFADSREQSQVKARIVAKYFWAWANVIIPTAKRYGGRIAYIDLFAGPGRYEDGTVSTPLMVLERAIEDPNMRSMLVTVFNDRDDDNIGKLRAAIDALPGVDTLKYKPQVSNEIVGEEIAKQFAALRLVPTFFFVDPWGYKGLSLGLIKAVIQNWGCDCVFFFNYNRVKMGLNNDAVREHMDALFGKDRVIRIFHGDFNARIHQLLRRGRISQNEATFCLLDQRTFQCRWSTLMELAKFKGESKPKIELFYFLAVRWLKRAVQAVHRENVLHEWWGRDDWSMLKSASPEEIKCEFVKRFKTELGYKSALAWPIYKQFGSKLIVYFMIHATDHVEAPKLMARAYNNAVRPRGKQLSFPGMADPLPTG